MNRIVEKIRAMLRGGKQSRRTISKSYATRPKRFKT